MAKKKNQFATQAGLEALLRFGPQEQALADLRQTAVDTYGQTVRAARGAAAGTTAAIQQATPGMRRLYNTTIGDQRKRQALVTADVAKLGNVADTLKAGSALEDNVWSRNIHAQKASSLEALAQQRVAAAQGRQFAVQNAGRVLQSDLAKVFRSKQQLAQQKGVFTDLTAQKLADAAAKQQQEVAMKNASLAQQERNSLRASGIDPDTGQPIPGGKLDRKGGKGGSKGLTPAQQRAARVQAGKIADQVRNAASAAHYLLSRAGGHYTTTQIRQILQGNMTLASGGSSKNGSSSHLSAPSYKYDHYIVNAAMDLAILGYIGKDNRRTLNRKGVVLHDNGLPSKPRRTALGGVGSAISGIA